MEYGSVNNLFSAAPVAVKPAAPNVGDGATFFHWTDRGQGR